MIPALSIEKNANKGGTTTILNTEDVCEALNRRPQDIAKYFSGRLGQWVRVQNGRLTLRGINIQLETIQNLLSKYIKLYVLCSVCGNSETIPSYGGTLTCKSCGYTSSLVNGEKYLVRTREYIRNYGSYADRLLVDPDTGTPR